MAKRARRSSFAVPLMTAKLAAASWETIMRRTTMMAKGTCSPAEYRRMTQEKVAASRQSMAALARGGSPAAMLAPFLSRASANAKRLRRKG